MPDKCRSLQEQGRRYSLYMRPWVLHADWATHPHVPYICDLNIVPSTRGQAEPQRNYARAWEEYIKGLVVSWHAKRTIQQFMAANCGRSKKEDNTVETPAPRNDQCAPNTLALQQLHKILDDVGGTDVKAKPSKHNVKQDSETDEEPAMRRSEQMKNAMCATTSLWQRDPSEWTVPPRNKLHSRIDLARHVKTPNYKHAKAKHDDPTYAQGSAYMKLKKTNIAAWWRKVNNSEKKPNPQQTAVIEAVSVRCQAEQAELNRWNGPVKNRRADMLSEPLRVCVLGDPGAGKSHCIHLLRSFFQEVMEWEHQMQFQFLAPQNSMAELVGGATVHTWGVIPIGGAAAGSKHKNKDVDWDQLFENCISMRWLIIDELSCLALGLLSMLDSFLRDKGCARHPYAHRNPIQRRNPRPFGGLNVIFCGDLWQLPPVKEIPIYAFPLHKADGEPYTAAEQAILAMFWKCKDSKDNNGIQKLFELTQAHRSKDAWQLAMLSQDRNGAESWEVYCFIHGLPTRNPGTWLPQTDTPSCGDALCKTLRLRWELSWKRQSMTWNEMQEMECQQCAAERRRRCRIISQIDDPDIHKQGIFREAPFVHPFRSPTNHAQRLRTLDFARARRCPVLWVVAHDELISKEKVSSKSSSDAAKANWLMYHDRWTAGIPGFMPLVLDLPVRFTCEPSRGDRTKGVFTNARGWLRGWELPAEELQRVNNLDEHEIALCLRPTRLYIETRSAHPSLDLIDGRRIYTLYPHSKAWYKDGDTRQIEIQRVGFPLVPDFGGTAHSYCGASLSACIGDLLEWHVRPQRESAIRGYIIKSRIDQADHLLLARPYSPQLFNQGVPPGPHYLREVMRGNLSYKDAIRQWTAQMNADKSKEETNASEKWPFCMTLPCRNCHSTKGPLPLTAFTVAHDFKEIWRVCISKGQLLTCYKCIRSLGWYKGSSEAVVYCDGCFCMKPRNEFDKEMYSRWQHACDDADILCKKCNNVSDKDADHNKYPCCGQGCASPDYQQMWPSNCFIKEDLVHSLFEGVSARCARCKVIEEGAVDKHVVCNGCHKSKHITEYSAIVCKHFLQKQDKTTGYRCNECQFPKCALCDNRPDKAISPNHLEKDGKWYCRKCRYPPCSKCRVTERPPGFQKTKLKFKEWVCADCTSKASQGATPPPVNASGDLQTQNCDDAEQNEEVGRGTEQQRTSKNSQEYKVCPVCERSPPLIEFRDRKATVCLSCQYPFCAANCGAQRPRHEKPMYFKVARANIKEEKW